MAIWKSSDANFKTQLTNIKNANPEIVFLPGYYTEIALIVTQARELGIPIDTFALPGRTKPALRLESVSTPPGPACTRRQSSLPVIGSL